MRLKRRVLVGHDTYQPASVLDRPGRAVSSRRRRSAVEYPPRGPRRRAARVGTATAVAFVLVGPLVTPLGVGHPTIRQRIFAKLWHQFGFTPVKSCNRPGDGTKKSYRTHLCGPVTLVAGAGLRVIELSS